MIGLERGTVMLCAHECAWKDLGVQYCHRIKQALGELAVAVEHVGSTSVADLFAKPIIDIAVGVRSFDGLMIKSMELAGFMHRPSHDDAHNMLFVDGAGEMRYAHIHIVLYNGMEWRNYLNFRDYLRAFEDVRKEYAELKQSLAKKFANNRIAYTDAKAEFIAYHLRKAMVWSYLGKHIEAEIDRPIGYLHVKGDKQLLYPVNYGFIPGVLGGDGEELDVYCLGIDQPIEHFTGKVLAIVHRADDVEDKLVACTPDQNYSAREICGKIHFQEKYYNTTIETYDGQILHISTGEKNGN